MYPHHSAGIEFVPRDSAVGARGYDIFIDCFRNGVLVRQTSDVIALSPPLVIEKEEIDLVVSGLADAIRRVA